MSALTFDKSELGNLEYSLQREMLATDRIGGYMSTTIVCCNTRRYHGLMVAPIDDSDRTYVLLSALDETIIQHDQTFNHEGRRKPGHLLARLHARRSRHVRRGAAHLPLEPAPAPPHGLRAGEVGLMPIEGIKFE